jgi:hypothetical protein
MIYFCYQKTVNILNVNGFVIIDEEKKDNVNEEKYDDGGMCIYYSFT